MIQLTLGMTHHITNVLVGFLLISVNNPVALLHGLGVRSGLVPSYYTVIVHSMYMQNRTVK